MLFSYNYWAGFNGSIPAYVLPQTSSAVGPLALVYEPSAPTLAAYAKAMLESVQTYVPQYVAKGVTAICLNAEKFVGKVPAKALADALKPALALMRVLAPGIPLSIYGAHIRDAGAWDEPDKVKLDYNRTMAEELGPLVDEVAVDGYFRRGADLASVKLAGDPLAVIGPEIFHAVYNAAALWKKPVQLWISEVMVDNGFVGTSTEVGPWEFEAICRWVKTQPDLVHRLVHFGQYRPTGGPQPMNAKFTHYVNLFNAAATPPPTSSEPLKK